MIEYNVVKWNASIFRGKIKKKKKREQMNTVQRAIATTRKVTFQVEDGGSSVATGPQWLENLLNVEETCKAWNSTDVSEWGERCWEDLPQLLVKRQWVGVKTNNSTPLLQVISLNIYVSNLIIQKK